MICYLQPWPHGGLQANSGDMVTASQQTFYRMNVFPSDATFGMPDHHA